MAIKGEDYEIYGATVFGTGPIGRAVHVPFERNITALYGMNGAGKSRLLRGVVLALSGVRPRADRNSTHRGPAAHLHVRLVPQGILRFEKLLTKAVAEDLARVRGELLESSYQKTRSADSSELFGPLEPASDDPLGDVLQERLKLLQQEQRVGLTDGDWTVLELLNETDVFTLMATGSEATPAWTVAAALPLSQPKCRRMVAQRFAGIAHQKALHRDFKATLQQEGELVAMALMDSYISNSPDDVLAGLVDTHSEIYLQDLPHSRVEDLPTWLALPIRALGVTRVPLVDVMDATRPDQDVDEQTVTALAEAAVADGREWSLQGIRPLVQPLIERAGATLRTVLPHGNAALTYEVLDEQAWFQGSRPYWGARVRGDEHVHPLSALSAAQQRWAELAVKLALANQHDLPLGFLCDEPEAGLHRVAEAAMPVGLARAMADHGASAVVATHSPYLLDERHVCPVLVSRDPTDAQTMVQPITLATLDALDAELQRGQLGLTPGSLVELGHVVVLVEGLHDEQLIRAVLGEQLSQATARLFPMRGAKRLRSVVEARLLFEGTSAPILVVLDNLGAEVEPVWQQIREAAELGEFDTARQLISSLKGQDEVRWVRELAEDALTAGRIDRLHLFGMTELDAVCYLPESSLLKPNLTWAEVSNAYREARGMADAGERLDFKKWLIATKRASTFSDEAVHVAVGHLEKQLRSGLAPHQDLRNLGARLVALADG